MNRRPYIAAFTLGALAAFGAIIGSSCTGGVSSTSGVGEDQRAAARALDALNDSQPLPDFRWSQIRQNLIEINRAQAETTQTTSFFFNLGVADPVSECPSIGFPIPTTAQLSNPVQAVGDIGHNGSGAVIAQIEQTGVYTGDSTGTYVICVDAQGRPYADYWEGFVKTVTGPAEWDAEAKRIRLIGPPSFEFTSGE